jgi:hypothetical protein
MIDGLMDRYDYHLRLWWHQYAERLKENKMQMAFSRYVGWGETGTIYKLGPDKKTPRWRLDQIVAVSYGLKEFFNVHLTPSQILTEVEYNMRMEKGPLLIASGSSDPSPDSPLK